MNYPEMLNRNVVIGDNGLLTNRPEVIAEDTAAFESSASLAQEKSESLLEARKQIALERIAVNKLPKWLVNVDLSALEGEEVIYEGDEILEQ